MAGSRRPSDAKRVVDGDVKALKVKLELPNHVIAEQMGWSERSVEKMIATYGHTSAWRSK